MPPGKEHDHYRELDPKVASAFAATFIHRHDCYPMQLDKGNYVTLKKPLTPEMVMSHIKGLVTLGAYALDANSTAHWLCLDADQPLQWNALRQLARQLDAEGLHLYIELSRRGGHGWLFTPPLPGQDMRRFGYHLLKKYGIEKMELYPKQDELKTGTGSLVRLPLGIHRKTGKRYPFITPDGEPLAPTIRQQLALLAKPRRVLQAYIDQILREAQEVEPVISHPEPVARIPKASGEHLSERIKNSISVFDFVSRYVELDALGKGFCPFHDDQEKSFGVHRERNFWHCYAGCEGQTVIDFWMHWREKHGQDGSFTATIKDLTQIIFG